MRGLGRIIFKLLGWSGILFLCGILGIIFAVRDSTKNIGSMWSTDFKIDIIFIAVGFIGGTVGAFLRVKKNKKAAEEAAISAAEQEKEAARRARSDPKNWNKPKPALPSPENVPLVTITDAVRRELGTLPMIPLIPKRAKTSVFDSKLGGVPYMPKDFPYPVGKSGTYEGKPLRFLAQLNFGALPHIPVFPEQGILQFYCSCDDDEAVYGMNFTDGCDQDGFRVIYHENVITDTTKLMTAEDIPQIPSGDFPFEGEYRLCPHAPEECPPTAVDFRFNAAFSRAYSRLTNQKITSVYDAYEGTYADGKTLEDVFDFMSTNLSCIGGYPDFTQSDPRCSEKGTSGHKILLFQLQSDPSDDVNIMWGDMGVGNFFITPEALKNKDFSNVLYNYDCC